jgi:hypothetical protein
MANGNPLANIGRANDPTLAPRVVAGSTAAAGLPGIGLKQILANQGGLRRQGLANVGSMRNKIMQLGFDPDDPDVMRKIAAIGTRNRVEQLGKIATGFAGRGFGTELTPGTTGLTMDNLGKLLGEIRSPEVRSATAGLVTGTETLEEEKQRRPRAGEETLGQSIPQKFISQRQVKTKGDPGRGFKLPGPQVKPQQRVAPPPAEQELPDIIEKTDPKTGRAGKWKRVSGTTRYNFIGPIE